ncbi:MAG: hypothetical protein V1754_07300 [Pseudomonadota bacterium]
MRKEFHFAVLIFGLFIGCVAQKKVVQNELTSSGLRLKPAPLWEVHSFSEVYPVTSLAILRSDLYVGTSSGWARFSLSDEEEVQNVQARGMAGEQIRAMSADSTSGLWVATETGISRFQKDVWTTVPAEKVVARRVTALLADQTGLWVGTKSGLGRFTGDGAWRHYLAGAQIVGILDDLVGSGVWVATNGEGVYQLKGDKVFSHSSSGGQPFRTVRWLDYTSDGGVLIAGNDGKEDGLAFFDESYWTSYRIEPSCKISWVKTVGGRTLFANEKGVFEIKRADPSISGPKKLPVGPFQIFGSRSSEAPSDYPIQYFYTEQVNMGTPVDPTAILVHERDILFGTRYLGVALQDGEETRWYRTNSLIGEAHKLKAACTSKICFLAGKNGQAFRISEQGIEQFGVSSDSTIQVRAFTLDPQGNVVALHTPPNSTSLVVSQFNGANFVRLFEVKISIPKEPMFVQFARYAPTGELWVGLAYLDEDKDRRPWGVAVLKKDGSIIYHRSSLLLTEDRAVGALALPDDIRDVFFDGNEVWFATGAGVCRVHGDEVVLFTENEGLESELTYAVSRIPGSDLLVASYGGVGRFGGQRWRFDFGKDLSAITRALVVQGDILWVGTTRGLVRWRNGEVKTINMADGLASNDVWDIVIQDSKHFWVLTSRGLSLVKL